MSGLDWSWVQSNQADIISKLGLHIVLALVPVLVALVLALPLGYLLYRTGRASGPLLAGVGIVYAIPSVAMFVALPLFLGTRILDPINIVVALTIYTLVLLLRSVVDGFRSVPQDVRQAAAAMGMGGTRRVLTVELPLAMPVVLAGLRVATVSNIALVSVGAVIGMGALGDYFDLGFRQAFYTPIIVAIVLIMVLALVFDAVILLVQRMAFGWTKVAR